MDILLGGLKPQTIDLCTVDTISSFANIPYYYYYANDADKPDFMPSELLRESLFATLLDFPILVGHLVMTGDGRAKVVVDKGNLNAPEFIESQSDVHFRTLQAAKFAWSALPDGVATVGSMTTASAGGVIKFVNVHIVRLRENSGVVIFASVPHYVVDGVGYCEFINRWAEVCRWMRAGETPEKLPAYQGTFSRNILSTLLPDSCKALDDLTRDLFTTSGLLSKWLAWISPRTRGMVLRTAASLTSIEGHVFYLSARGLAALHALTSEHLSNGERITDNDILTALISMSVAQSEAECSQDAVNGGYMASLAAYLAPSLFALDRHFSTEFVCDARPRLPGLKAARYTGNTVFVRCLASKLKDLAGGINGQTLACEARRVRQTVHGVDAQYIGQLFGTLNADPSSFMCPIAQSFTKTAVVISNQSRFSLYDTDFGNGMPVWVSPITTFYANFVSILPTPPSDGGYTMFVTLSKQAMAKLLQNEAWMNSVELLY
ncbi:hypothetical protein IWW39_005590 [Coemansia spiralis]|uniref:Uncharacterized protein n=1 Tax=Coemansia spiralis TaxID=417178 RepID=A0A9W8L0L2_9FUNG|nr:hypothetical protein IWW39_005590 [Coemansia spiralis]